MDELRCYRPLIIGRRGAVAANHPLAAQAGLMALRAGGNAADAAVATALALSVVEPMMSGLGGDAFYHLFEQASGRALVFNGTGPAPKAATPERYAGGIPRTGPMPVSVPGMLAGLGAMHRQFGRVPWAELCTEAIRYASDGYGATPHYRHFAGEHLATLRADRRSAATFLADGGAPQAGAPIVQPDLARTLGEIAAEGPDCLYRGALARRFARGLAECGALVTEADLAEFEAERQQPLAVDYRGFTVLEAPPNSTGFVVLEELKIVENFDLARMGLASADLVHVLVEAKKLAFADRERWGSDPRTVEPPFAEILSAQYCAGLAERIDMRRAAPTRSPVPASGDTTYFCVVDGDGNAVSGIQSINSAWGSGVTAGDTGILLNNRMAYWHLDPAHPNFLRPGRRVRHTMNPPLVLKDGALWCVCGTPGADNQVQINLQILTAMIDLGLDPQQAAEMPRWTSNVPGQYANYPHDGPDVLTMERRFSEAVRRDLAERGHPIDTVGDLDGPCSVEIIRRLPDGTLLAGSDPRRDGWALAW
ncbi:MAG TPA: gamma-glutamyltransferase [Stellaceae bacterium]|jgi:gamma-glutamyltranspeptidase/glutathione hydrolase|nr:gamma-glutamyltransferase [Stellaceae bacterium]